MNGSELRLEGHAMFRFGRSKCAVINSSTLLLCLISLQSCAVVIVQEKANSDAKAVSLTSLWRDPGDISSLNLEFGQGGKDHAPDPEATYRYVKEDLRGSSPKFYVTDQDGVEWLVKVGDEARPETAATRFVWAMGFFTDEDYFVPKLHVSGMPKLRRIAELNAPANPPSYRSAFWPPYFGSVTDGSDSECSVDCALNSSK